MATKTESAAPGAASLSLQRGKACLRCRKRKMRCDGIKPACNQCIRAKKADCCEYDDGKGKTRTQILRETISRLENRIRELEDPEYISPAVQLYDPHFHQRSGSSSSSLGSPPASAPISASHSPFPSESTNSPHGSWSQLSQGIPSPSPSPFTPEMFYEEPQQPPFELAQMLLDIYAPHRQQSGLQANVGRLRDSLALPASEQRHPALMNSIYLWACFVSRPEPLCQHEDHYLARALEALPEAIRLGDKVIDAIQASCLLSTYFLANGRVTEGSYHASAAAGLAVQCGLHRGISSENQSWMFQQSTDAFDIKPLQSAPSESDRVMAFWQVFNLDRCWSVMLRKPPMIPDGPDAWNIINMPWPHDISDYETGQLDTSAAFMTVKSFLGGEVAGGFSLQALRAKASALFHRADQLATSWDPRITPSGPFLEEVQTIERSIAQFISGLIPPHQLDASMLDDKPLLVALHTLAHCATIRLFQRFAQSDPVSYTKCLRAARSCVDIIKYLSDGDFNFFEPIIGHCWTDAADILVRELNNIESSWPLMNTTDVRNDLGVLLYAMTSIGARLPLLGAYQQTHPWIRPLFLSVPRPLSGGSPGIEKPQTAAIAIPDTNASRLERSATARRVSRHG
ncbi:hypothetical protein HGRIS_003025 [Hohenbuehelia grisea]|uniref:Zn(2)-C6 fungal-type domain-containing protein n=1 Tax=Hohenbuehelia grisea TaxID=104357 RepID=A0ABR3JPC4_9AGAR